MAAIVASAAQQQEAERVLRRVCGRKGALQRHQISVHQCSRQSWSAGTMACQKWIACILTCIMHPLTLHIPEVCRMPILHTGPST